ncbi:hypothetical protein THRCLA_06436 [Thraustotheca clavata]|uniref:RGS domain-containing protein n=1 Tax=Thraustotheca clavata TaxID=74557 RepID=A0A1V9ZNP9_9STRA|nr:hypothetical protein THRCLA_06436 [Thraustotheca clavata]
MVVATDTLLVLTWAMHVYMPIALYLFLSRREPVPMGLAASFFTIYTFSVPPILCFGGTTTYTLILFFEWVVLLTGVVTYLLTQCILVVRFHITEILMHPVQATVPRVNQTKYLRWLLYPRFQLGLWIIFTILLNIPTILETHGMAITTQAFESDSNDDLTSFRLNAGIETAVLIVASYFLARSMSRIVDNFGLKETYVRGAHVMAFGVALYGLVSALIAFEIAPGLEIYRIPTLIGLHTAHIIFVMTIVLPLRTSYIAKETHKDLKTRIRPNKRDVDQLESMVLYRYLSTDEGFADFLAFSKKELYADTILAWKEVQKYKEGLVSIEHIYNTCLDASSRLQVNLSSEVRKMYEIQRPMVCTPNGSERRNRLSISLKRLRIDTVKTMHLSSVAPIDNRMHHAAHSPSSYTNIEEISRKSVVPPKNKFEKLFHPLGAEILRIIYTEVLPRFEQHASTAQWIAFRNREKAMLSLDVIEHMINGTIDHGADIAQRGSMPCIADLQRIIPPRS